MIGIGVWHSVEVYDQIDFWEKYTDYAEATTPVCEIVEDKRFANQQVQASYHCLCNKDTADYLDSGYTGKYSFTQPALKRRCMDVKTMLKYVDVTFSPPNHQIRLSRFLRYL